MTVLRMQAGILRQPHAQCFTTHIQNKQWCLPRRIALAHARQLGVNATVVGVGSNRSVVCQATGDAASSVPSKQSPNTFPTDRVLKLWRKANAVCFDVDCEFRCYVTHMNQTSLNLCMMAASFTLSSAFTSFYLKHMPSPHGECTVGLAQQARPTAYILPFQAVTVHASYHTHCS